MKAPVETVDVRAIFWKSYWNFKDFFKLKFLRKAGCYYFDMILKYTGDETGSMAEGTF